MLWKIYIITRRKAGGDSFLKKQLTRPQAGFFLGSVPDYVGITDPDPSEVKFWLRGCKPRVEPERRRIGYKLKYLNYDYKN